MVVAGCAKTRFNGCIVWCVDMISKKRREGGKEGGKRLLLGMCPMEARAHGMAYVPNYSFLQYPVYTPSG